MSLNDVLDACGYVCREEKDLLSRSWEDPAYRALVVYTMRRCNDMLEKRRGGVKKHQNDCMKPLRYLVCHPVEKLKSPNNRFLGLVYEKDDFGDYSDIILLAVKAGASPNREISQYRYSERDTRSPSVLSVVAREGRVDVVSELLDLGSAPCGASLEAALKAQKRDVVQLLLEKGADPNFYTDEGKVPLCLALEGPDFQLVHMLFLQGADPSRIQERDLAMLPLEKLERFLDMSGYSLAGDSKLLQEVCGQLYDAPRLQKALRKAAKVVVEDYPGTFSAEEKTHWVAMMLEVSQQHHPAMKQWRAKLDMLMSRRLDRSTAGPHRERLDSEYPA